MNKPYQMSSKKVYIFGAGISGSTVARILAEKNYQVMIYEQKPHVGGNCYDFYSKNKVLTHKYGPHIFHTSNKEVLKFINKFTKLNSYKNEVLSCVNDKLIPLPINYDSIKMIADDDADYIIKILNKKFPKTKTITFYELRSINDPKAKKFANYVFKNMYAKYSSKMWGTDFSKISAETINRVKICLSHNRSYFPDDKCQGLPVNGYTNMIKKMLNHKNIKIELNSEHKLTIKNNKTYIDSKLVADPIFYCGSIDELQNYQYGILPYRSLDIKFTSLNRDSYQNNAVINYPADKSMTRIAEYKKMTLQKIKNKTVISKEYPGQFSLKSKKFNIRYYPISNKANDALYSKYLKNIKNTKNLFLLGRLAEYKYYDMDDAIASAFTIVKKIK